MRCLVRPTKDTPVAILVTSVQTWHISVGFNPACIDLNWCICLIVPLMIGLASHDCCGVHCCISLCAPCSVCSYPVWWSCEWAVVSIRSSVFCWLEARCGPLWGWVVAWGMYDWIGEYANCLFSNWKSCDAVEAHSCVVTGTVVSEFLVPNANCMVTPLEFMWDSSLSMLLSCEWLQCAICD